MDERIDVLDSTMIAPGHDGIESRRLKPRNPESLHPHSSGIGIGYGLRGCALDGFLDWVVLDDQSGECGKLMKGGMFWSS